MSRVLITGGAGFIGSHLADAYTMAGHSVIALDNLSSGDRSNLDGAMQTGRCELVEADVRDAAIVRELVARSDLVIHMAARIGLKLVVASALATIEDNVEGTQALLRETATRGCKTIVASTSEVYGLSTRIPSAEDDPMVIGSPQKSRWSYACSKALDESIALAYQREKGLPAVVVRLFNTVGPRQSARYGMVIPRFVRQALEGRPLTVYGDGTQTRCFCYVGDVVKAIMALGETAAAVGTVVNVGNPNEIAIVDLAKRVIAMAQSQSQIRFVPFEEAYEANFEEIMRRVPDISRARAMIGFSPSVDLNQILYDFIGYTRSRPTAPAIS